MVKHKWIGRAVYIRTLGEQWVGVLIEETPLEVVIKNAGWLAEAGLVGETATHGLYRETLQGQNDAARDIECVPHEVHIGRGHILAWTLFADKDGVDHKLPTTRGLIQGPEE